MSVIPFNETRSVTIELPEPVYRHLAQIADATHQPVESIAAQSVTGNLPPSVETAPEALRNSLLSMQLFSNEGLMEIARERVADIEQARHLELVEKNGSSLLSSDEAEELQSLRAAADRLMVRKAYAWALLRWRGYPVPSLDELSLA
jgi:hypothetical protein